MQLLVVSERNAKEKLLQVLILQHVLILILTY